MRYLILNKIEMKTFRERFSITKLVLLLLVLALIFIEIWNVVNEKWIDQLFTDVLIAVVSFYFWQKGISYDSVDSLVEKSEVRDTKIWFDLDDNKDQENDDWKRND